ncbi:hypothetical protein ACKVWC_009026 [Pyricularia oryzae]|nr:hypothetical protein MCOR31_001361 [Pyricularia oryzae]KAI6424599.1 hypothetical protein MCOR24_003363 [Pyricularia oryzae]KAI6529496.1 hypothetical protein MCOR10_003687 [Pyricularia oryzae]KAI6534220.1 hypothetical protein MCOR05_006427 [Pyricularia oryzae]KAI6600084.1 hypothetical protein MCOR06_000994 [Pyricularia oryzae]
MTDPSVPAPAVSADATKDETTAVQPQHSRPPSPEVVEEKEFKEGGYGWVIVLAVHLLNAHTWGINASYSVFLAYYLRSGAFAGASPIAYAFVGGLSISIALGISPIATISVREFGTRNTLLLGSAIITVAFIGASFTTQMWQLVLSQGIAFGLGMGFTFVASVGVVPQWFVKRRSLANGLGAGGSGMGGLIYSLATNAMIKDLGLSWTFRVLALIVLVVNCISSVLVKDRNKELGTVQVAFHKDLFKRPEYYLLIAWAFFSILGYTITVFSLSDYCQTVGFTATQGSVVAALYSMSQGIGRPIIGHFSDSWGRINVAAIGTLISAVASFTLWIFAGPHFGGVIVFALLGVFTGILWATIGPVSAEVVGLELLPSALSVIWLVLAVPATFAMVIGVSLRVPGPGGYLFVQVFVGSMYLFAFTSAWFLRGWKLWQLENLDRNKSRGAGVMRNDDAAVTGDTGVDATLPGGDQQTSREKETLAAYLMRGKWIISTKAV